MGTEQETISEIEKTEKTKHEIDMVNGPILKKMLVFAFPLMCSGVLQLLFNAADIIVVGRFAGDNSLAAVGSTTSLINLLSNLFIGLSVGGNVLAARYFGARREKDLSETVQYGHNGQPHKRGDIGSHRDDPGKACTPPDAGA